MKFDFNKIEKEMLRFWGENRIFEKLQRKIQGKRPWSFLDGPITANNPMGVHHAWGRTLKDLFQRYKAMQGFDQRFQNGFDCQGLWVEVEVEKELGFKNKKDIEKYGIERFVEKCKERVRKYSGIQTEQSQRLGQWMDWEHSYFTMSDENNYAIWHFLKICWQKGLLHKGRDVVPWCPRCLSGDSKILLENGISKTIEELGTSWKNHEVAGFSQDKNKIETAPLIDYISNSEKQVFKLVTSETGRSILATADHPFWVRGRGWVNLAEIHVGEKVAVYPHPEISEDNSLEEKRVLNEEVLKNIVTNLELKRGKKVISNEVSNYRDLITLNKWNLDKEIQSFGTQNYTIRQIQNELLLKRRINISFNAIRNAGKIKKKNCTLEYVIHELEAKNLLPLTTKNQNLPIIARLIGHIFGDGFLILHSGERKNFEVGFTGKEEDLMEIRKDLDKLGFVYTPVRRRFTASNLKDRTIQGYSTEFRVYSISLAVLLLSLGAPLGKKSERDYEVPKWLFRMPKHIIREFLAAYFGSELTKIRVYGKKFDALRFSLNKDRKLVESGYNFVRQIAKLLKKFDIKIQNVRCRPAITRKNGSKSVKIEAVFSQSFDNLLNFCKFIGYRYSKEREEMARYVQEYLEIRDRLKKEKIKQYSKIHKLRAQGIPSSKIAEILNVPKEVIWEILRAKTLNFKIKNFPPFNQWLKEATENGKNQFVWETIKEIKKQDKRDVFDFSVNPLHSFIANGFIVHNCGTAISQHEILTEDYKEIVHKAVFFKAPLKNQKNTYFLAWTTTPWTLPGNVVLAVSESIKYQVLSSEQDKCLYIVAKERASDIFQYKDVQVKKEVLGKDLLGLEYEPLFEFSEQQIKSDKNFSNAFKVVAADFVSADEGTGIVHIAPGCGAEDFQLSKQSHLPVIDLTDQESKYRKGFGDLTGRFVGSNKARDWIFDQLQAKGLLFRAEDYEHRYPVCWRCKSELIFRLVDEWYIKMDSLREGLKKITKQIKWLPGFGQDREIDWLNNMQDWLISKKRYWGLALPVFECSECGNFEVIGSKQELKQRAVEGWQAFQGHSPHRPWLDNIRIKCSKCGALVPRILDVGTPWLDAGIVPFSTLKYFEDKNYWQKWFPADFICESFPGQFKNWFYVLLVMSDVLEGRPPFKTVLGYATVVDEKGEEMHKSKGNAIWFDEAVEKMGADVMRWMYAKQNPANNMRFGYQTAEETKRKLLTLVNCYTFFETYASNYSVVIPRPRGEVSSPAAEGSRSNTTGSFVVEQSSAPQDDREGQFSISKNILDQWVLSKLNGLISEVTACLDKFDSAKASQAIEDFFINDLSLWYIRRSRPWFQDPEDSEQKQQASQVLYWVLLSLAKLLAPFLPFLSEHLYQKLKTNDMPESVHLCDWPQPNKQAINKGLEDEMAQVRKIVSEALSLRAEKGIKVRQPLQSIKYKVSSIKDKKELLTLIKNEVNVKKAIFDKDLKKEVELDTEITPELKEEGQVREVIRYIQALRKKAGLTPADLVALQYNTSLDLAKVIEKNKPQILKTTRSQSLKQNPQQQGLFLAQKQTQINTHPLWLAIEK